MPIATDTLLEQAREGFETVRLSPEIRGTALRRLREWLETDKLAGLLTPSDYRPLLEQLIADGKWDFLVDSFYQTIPFGTGGRRGRSASGPTASTVHHRQLRSGPRGVLAAVPAGGRGDEGRRRL